MDPAELARLERAALEAAHRGACEAIRLIPGGSPWTQPIWDWGRAVERALYAEGRPSPPEPVDLPSIVRDEKAA